MESLMVIQAAATTKWNDPAIMMWMVSNWIRWRSRYAPLLPRRLLSMYHQVQLGLIDLDLEHYYRGVSNSTSAHEIRTLRTSIQVYCAGTTLHCTPLGHPDWWTMLLSLPFSMIALFLAFSVRSVKLSTIIDKRTLVQVAGALPLRGYLDTMTDFCWTL